MLTARLAKALGHPVRVAIVQMLLHENCCYHGDMSEVIPVAKSTLSQHLKELKEAGLIQGTITPPTVRYCIDNQNWQKARELFGDFFAEYPATQEKVCEQPETLVSAQAEQPDRNMNSWPQDSSEEDAIAKIKLKEIVRSKYSEIAVQGGFAISAANSSGCCSTGCCSSTEVYNIMSDDYSELQGYNADADMGLGCGLPTQFARIKKGDTVIDLGSGAGNDCFVARAETGESGMVIGVDFTPAMVERARQNADKLGYSNVRFQEDDIENMHIADHTADVVISNCVLNLLPAKDKIYREIYRVLKPGGHFCISDIVTTAELPPAIKEAAGMYTGCVAGAIAKSEYLAHINQAGFAQVRVEKEKAIELPDDILERYLDAAEMELFRKSKSPIVSVTVTGIRL